MNFKPFFKVFFVIAMLVGCQTPPTKVYETQKLPEAKKEQVVSNEVKIVEETIILDARPSFDFELWHYPGSVNIQWNEIKLEDDLFAVARRLALYGVAPDVPVVVLGNGEKSKGEDGRLAWALSYLGVKNVKFASVDHFKFRKTFDPPPQKPNAPVWKPQLNESLRASVQEVRDSLQNGLFVIDVRDGKTFLKDKRLKLFQNTKIINIPYKDFFESSGLVKLPLLEQLTQVGLKPNEKIIVISEDGVASGAVTMALRALNFEKAANFAGKYSELL